MAHRRATPVQTAPASDGITKLTPYSIVGLLIRGEAFRWGCSRAGIASQHAAAASHSAMIATPLMAAGHDVRTFFALRGECGTHPQREAAKLFGGDLDTAEVIGANGQAEGMRAALNMVLAARSAKLLDFLIISRWDLELRYPISHWNLRSDVVSFSSRCEPHAWGWYNCSSDILFGVPSRYLKAFNASVGAVGSYAARTPEEPSYKAAIRGMSKCCFHSSCTSGPSNTGHGYDAI